VTLTQATNGQTIAASGGGGGSGALTLISNQVVSGSSTTTVTFSSIPGTYTHLEVFFQARMTGAFAQGNLELVVNGDTGNNYSWYYAGQSTGTNNSVAPGTAPISSIAGASTAANGATAGHIRFMNYAATTFYKEAVTEAVDGGSSIRNYIFTWQWANTAAINSLAFSDQSGSDFVAGSTFTLYGVQ